MEMSFYQDANTHTLIQGVANLESKNTKCVVERVKWNQKVE